MGDDSAFMAAQAAVASLLDDPAIWRDSLSALPDPRGTEAAETGGALPGLPAPTSRPSPKIRAARQEVKAMLGTLEGMLREATALGREAQNAVAAGGLSRFRRFRLKVEDFLTLVMVVDGRIAALGHEAPAESRLLLDRLYAQMMVRFVEASRLFFERFVRLRVLPLGASALCKDELRALNEFRRKLNDPQFNGERGHLLRAHAEQAVQNLEEVMRRSPDLPEFEGAAINDRSFTHASRSSSSSSAPISFGLSRQVRST